MGDGGGRPRGLPVPGRPAKLNGGEDLRSSDADGQYGGAE